MDLVLIYAICWIAMVVKAHLFFATRCKQVQVEQTLDWKGCLMQVFFQSCCWFRGSKQTNEVISQLLVVGG